MIDAFIFYRGKSMIDGKPIVAVATGLKASGNPKTGNMVQTWIIPDNGIMPHENVKTGADASVCGDCKHRPVNGGACYVKTFQAPRSIYAKVMRGGYTELSVNTAGAVLAGRIVRLGAYGDPAAVPFEVWSMLLAGATAWTGYTHQWQREGFDARIIRFCMASVDSEAEAVEAAIKGYRYFRVKTSTCEKITREVTCPASEEAGKKLTCSTCLACGGTNGRKGNIVINAHGSTASRFSVAA